MGNSNKASEKKRLLFVYLLLATISLLSFTLLLILSPFYQTISLKKGKIASLPPLRNSEYLEKEPHKQDSPSQRDSFARQNNSSKQRESASLAQEREQTSEESSKKASSSQRKKENSPKNLTPSIEKSQKGAKKAPPKEESSRASVQKLSPPFKKIPLYLVLDDVGGDLVKLKKFLALPIPITYAVIPFLAYSTQSAQLIHSKGKEVIIHQPMEPLHSENPGEGALFTWMSKDAIFKQLSRSFANVPYAVGMNNHMGSKATADVGVMSAVLDYLGTSGLFFLDSKTTVNVVGESLAQSFHCPYVQRNAMFLDNERDRESIEKAIQNGLKTAKKSGHAVMIGHVMTTELAEVLLEIYPDILDEGYAFYNLSQYFTDFDGED